MKTPVLALLWTRELINKDALCLFICFLVTIREERKVDKLLFFLGDILIGFKHHIFMISNEKGKWQEYQRKMS